MTGSPPSARASADEVVSWLLGAAPGCCLDEQGRPLAEQASPHYRSVERWEERRVFGDARDATGLPCNVAALSQVQAAWSALLSGLSAMDAGQPDTMARTLRRASAGVRLAPLLVLRVGPAPAPVPAPVAALYKLTLGVGDLCAAVLLEERVDADDPTPSVAQLDALLDERPWLIGLAQVCAGSRAQIRRAWTALAASVPAAPFSELAAPWFQDALSALMELEALAAARAGAARSALLRGDHPGELGGVLFGAARVPLWVEALRQVQGAGPAHASLLFSSDRVPSSLRAFVEASGRDAPVDLDQALLAAASEPAGRLLRALSRSAHPTLTTAAFEGSCSS